MKIKRKMTQGIIIQLLKTSGKKKVRKTAREIYICYVQKNKDNSSFGNNISEKIIKQYL